MEPKLSLKKSHYIAMCSEKPRISGKPLRASMTKHQRERSVALPITAVW